MLEKNGSQAPISRYSLIAGFSFALVGAVMAFALKDSETAWLGVKLEPLGGVLLAIGALLILAAGVGSLTGGDGVTPEGIQHVGGLVAVVTGITAVTALAIVTAQLVDNQQSAVAVTSSAFGMISAVVGAYLGIKITADTHKTGQKEATEANERATKAQQKLDAVTTRADEVLSVEDANKLKAAAIDAGGNGDPPAPPPQGG